ncbi:hypothetical protein [Polymorphospora lycopeni]|uniref:Uncharacterized protein n=1 Tax=Polymorphospora lycopeni TaxID=3140240 RepID=A0ABV5CMJ4_9ACTN
MFLPETGIHHRRWQRRQQQPQGLTEGHLVYATDHEPEREYRLVGSGVRVMAHGLDLAGPLSELRGQIERLADRVARAAVTARANSAR